MKIHRLLVRDFRGVSEREIRFPDAGVVILEGDNEVGKSTMIEALDLLLDEKDSSKKAAVRDVRPVNADVGSYVEAEISSGPYRMVYAKQFNKGTSTTLQIVSPTPEHLAGTEAHERVVQILDQTMDRQLWAALRMMQAAPLAQARPGDSGTLTAALDQAAGSTGHHEANDPLVEAVEREFLQYFTPTGKPTGAYREATQRLESARSGAELAAGNLAEITSHVEELNGLQRKLTELESQRQDAATDLAGITQALQALESLQEQHQAVEQSSLAAQQAAEQAMAALAARQEMENRCTKRRDDLQKAQEQVSAAEGELQLAETGYQQELETTTQLRIVLRATQDAAVLARGDLDHLRATADRSTLESRLTELTAASRELEHVEKALGANPLTDELLRQIDDADHATSLAEARLQAASTRVQLRALGPEATALRQDDAALPLEAAESHTFALVRATTLTIPGVVAIELAPAEDSRFLQDQVSESTTLLADLLRQAGAADPAQAHTLHEERRLLESRKETALRDKQRLRGAQEVEELEAELLLITARLEDYRRQRPQAPGLPPDLPSARALSLAADDSQAAAAKACEQSQRGLDAAKDSLQQARINWATLSSTAGSLQGELEAETSRLERAREITSDAQLQTDAQHTQQLQAEALNEEKRLADELLRADLPTLSNRKDNTLALIERLTHQRDDLEERARDLKARLAVAGSQGRQDAYDAALIECEAAEELHSSLDRRAGAVRLLHETVQKYRTEARKNYVQPFRDSLNGLGWMVYGQDFDVEVDGNLHIVTRTLGGLTVGYEALSTGAKEQLGIITRLACALIVDPENGVPLIIDDALGYSDSGRLNRLGSMFGSVAHRAQIILLTCTPDRYRIGHATPILLTAQTRS
ncbi:AAA family ATPase [Psychromicrobium xiongbiense]|uniref:AAA family ATPase n=1 Tax=Psychromicrobium xiongbiense TaxID=3051184 RepID=UPI002557C62D|nr:AAA family ATPase [Psychromicrobium sp. YIM S02556]